MASRFNVPRNFPLPLSALFYFSFVRLVIISRIEIDGRFEGPDGFS